MYSRTAKVAAIHDLSGVGRCSLSVILPTLSSQGIQVCPVPTAILSAHTGGFGEVVLRDLTDYISPALEHYKRLNYEFDCVYSGFLASTEQIDHCLEIKSYLVRLSELGPKIVVITSVFSDGKAYNVGYDREHSKFWRIPYNMINARYPGTGDVFASVLTGSILRGDSLPIAMNRATAFLERAIKTTYSYSTDTREGIMLESCLDFLITNPTLCDYEQM